MRYRQENKKRKVSTNRLLVLCEGKTEKFYLEGLRRSLPKEIQRNIDLDIVTAKDNEPTKAISELIAKRTKAKSEKQPYLDCWLVFDDDNRNLEKVFQLLKKENISFVFNSIAIEFWFLIHYCKTNKHYDNAHAVIVELKKVHENYSKTDVKLWEMLESKYNTAKEQAEYIRKQHQQDKIALPTCKPFTNMDELVERIMVLVNTNKKTT